MGAEIWWSCDSVDILIASAIDNVGNIYVTGYSHSFNKNND